MSNLDETVLKGKTILVVDDEVDLRDIVASELEYMGAKIFQAPNVEAAREILKLSEVDLIVSDIRMPGGTGIDLLKFVKSKNVNVPPMILITGFADITTEDAFNNGAEALLSKPFKLDELIQTAARLTAPVENRFKMPHVPSKTFVWSFEDTLPHLISMKECSIGRGGLALVIDLQTPKSELGEVIKFQLKFKDLTLEGTGLCRWWKLKEPANKAILGLEFLHLSGPTLDYLLNRWKAETIVAFIPALS